jgi:nitronate monooxygenase
MWPDTRLIDLLGVDAPIIQAPMAGVTTPALAAAVSDAGGLGSLGCAMLSHEDVALAAERLRAMSNRPFNLNFFCHPRPERHPDREVRWLKRAAPYYAEAGLPLPADLSGPAAFDEAMCATVERIAPRVVSFHFGLPAQDLVGRLRRSGCLILSSATNPREARILAERGVDAVIAQGAEAGGHRGTFAGDHETGMIGTMALVPQIVNAVDVPVIAAGGIADGRGIAAALMLGASGVQIGTAYLFSEEAQVSPLHRAALETSEAGQTAVTNVLTGRPARSIVNRIMRDLGPIAPETPDFPLLNSSLMPVRAAAEARGATDFTPLWSGQAAPLGKPATARELTERLADDALRRLKSADAA